LEYWATEFQMHYSAIPRLDYCDLFHVVTGLVFFNRLNFLNDLNVLNFFKSWTHMSLLLSGTAL
jgi:hypothetical protein